MAAEDLTHQDFMKVVGWVYGPDTSAKEFANFVQKYRPANTTSAEDFERFKRDLAFGDEYALEMYSRWLLKI